MKTCCIYIIVFLSFILGSPIYGEEKSPAVMKCLGPACDRTANKVPYHFTKAKDFIKLKTGHFSLEIPDKPIRKIASTSEEVIILYRDDQLLYVSESSGPEIEGIPTELAYRYPQILFTKTPRDALPDTNNARLFWEIALASKPFYFQDAPEVTYTDNSDFTYYLSNTHQLGFSARGMVTNSRFKHLFLVMEAKQMDLETFRQVIYSAK